MRSVSDKAGGEPQPVFPEDPFLPVNRRVSITPIKEAPPGHALRKKTSVHSLDRHNARFTYRLRLKEKCMSHPAVKDLTVEEVKSGMDAGKILLIDVREPDELAIERIPGALDMPLKSFNPAALPDPRDKKLVFFCRSGNRSINAALLSQQAGLPYDAHMAGGIKAWKAAGFDTESG